MGSLLGALLLLSFSSETLNTFASFWDLLNGSNGKKQVPELSFMTLTRSWPGLGVGVGALWGAVDRARSRVRAAVSFPRGPCALLEAETTDVGLSFH